MALASETCGFHHVNLVAANFSSEGNRGGGDKFYLSFLGAAQTTFVRRQLQGYNGPHRAPVQ